MRDSLIRDCRDWISASYLHINRAASETTVLHQNRLPKLRCWAPKHTSFKAFAECFPSYASVCQPCNPHESIWPHLPGAFPSDAKLPSSLKRKSKDGQPISHKKVRFNQDKDTARTVPTASKPKSPSTKEQLLAAHIRFGHAPFGVLVHAAK